MTPMSDEEKAARVAAAKAKSASKPAASPPAATGGDTTSPADKFRQAKDSQKAFAKAVQEAGPDAAARAAAAREAVAASSTKRATEPVTRREFLMYAWSASIALLLAGSGVTSFYFLLPRFREGEFGGIFPVPISQFPPRNGAPVPNDLGKYWLVNTDEGYNVLYKVCTHLGCLYAWSDVNQRFECPCHGSKFELDGSYIEGPAPRGLDRFRLTVQDTSGNVIAQSDGSGVEVNDPNATVLIDTGQRIDGPPHGAA